MKLYDLTDQYYQAQLMYDQAETEQERQDADDFLSGIEADLSTKVENIARLVKNLTAEADVFRAESKRLADKAKSLDNQTRYLKRYLQVSLESAGVDKVKGELFTVAIQNNAPSLNILDTSHIPAQFIKQSEPTVDKRVLLDYIKETGETFPGVEVNRTRSVRIR